LFNDFGRLPFELGLYIKMEPLLSVPELLGTAVLFDIGRMGLSVMSEIVWMEIEPGLYPGVIATTAIGVVLPPSGIVVFL
jgi:hypothetical protein